MAKVKDYIGRSFGDFRIEAELAHGSEADVFICRHLPTHISYVLRLSAKDPSLWSGDPVIPPRNAALEAPNAGGSWRAASAYHLQYLESREQGEENAWDFRVAAIYGVFHERYLVPAASPVWRRGALRIDQLLEMMPAGAVDGRGPLEELLLTMATTASIAGSTESESEQWVRQWSKLAGGRIATETARRYLRSGMQSAKEKEKAIDLVASSGTEGQCEIAENILLRTCSCIARGILSINDAWATLHCKHFRINVTYQEIEQLIAAHDILNAEFLPNEELITLLRFMLTALSEQPDDEHRQPELFDLLIEPPNLKGFDLYLQEYVGRSQQIPSVTFEKKRLSRHYAV